MDSSRHSFQVSQPLGDAEAGALSHELVAPAQIANRRATAFYPEHFVIAALVALSWLAAGWLLLG